MMIVPIVGELSADTTPADFRRFEEAAQEFYPDGTRRFAWAEGAAEYMKDSIHDYDPGPEQLCGCMSAAGDEWEVYLCPLHAAAPELLEVCIETRNRLLAFGLEVIFNDLDTDPRVAEALKEFQGLVARLDAVIKATEVRT